MEANRAVDTANMNREEWLEARRRGIGGSDAAAIMGASPWATKLTVYADKLGMLPEKDDTIATRFGRDVEEVVAKWFSEDTGKKVRRVNAILQHPDYPWMLANIDRKVQGESAGLECKTTSAFNRTDFEGGSIPPYYYWQCVHYMAVTGFSRWYLAVIHGNSGFYHYEIPRNEEHIKLLIEREEQFWENHVLAEVPPLPDGKECDDNAIDAMSYGFEPTDENIDLSDYADIFERLALAETALKTSKENVDALKQQIKMGMIDATHGECGKWKIFYASQSRTTIDAKRLKAELPQVYEQYKKVSESRPLLIKKEA